MQTKKTVNPPLPSDFSRGEARQWLMAGGDPDEAHVAGVPLLLWFVLNEGFDGTTELLASGANPNVRDDSGRGWLHYCLRGGVPLMLTLEGMRRLDTTWWYADDAGSTPLHLPVRDSQVAQAMIVRWWSEQRPWSLLRQPFDPLEHPLPQQSSWKTWQSMIRR